MSYINGDTVPRIINWCKISDFFSFNEEFSNKYFTQDVLKCDIFSFCCTFVLGNKKYVVYLQ